MSNNEYMEQIAKHFNKLNPGEKIDMSDMALLALVKELQTLNETLIRLTETDDDESLHLSVKVRKGPEL